MDSRTMLDSAGAEKLLGNGDMLFLSVSATGMKRIQGVYVSEEEVKKVVSFVKNQKIERGEEEIGENIVAGAPGEQQELDLPSEDKLDFGSMKFEAKEIQDRICEGGQTDRHPGRKRSDRSRRRGESQGDPGRREKRPTICQRHGRSGGKG
ncbi:MAG: Sporulation protein SpoIIIE, DNA segregation ATPase [Parcubacteria group bacterium GW2011_GWC1_45_14]|nr:MAG: Sporulation protein SpoIIIE, DNA segregation ATPase [Parcubacteria group bacterium GW2011_GWC1_45_14]